MIMQFPHKFLVVYTEFVESTRCNIFKVVLFVAILISDPSSQTVITIILKNIVKENLIFTDTTK